MRALSPRYDGRGELGVQDAGMLRVWLVRGGREALVAQRGNTFAGVAAGATEIHPGNYVFFDRQQMVCLHPSSATVAAAAVLDGWLR